jgi:hypothetical protein
MMSTATDLTAQEQAHVRAALRFLRSRCGGWAPLGKALRFKVATLGHVANGRAVSPTVAFRVARFAKVGLDDLLAGKFLPPGACPHCGHFEETQAASAAE